MPTQPTILVIDNEAGMCRMMQAILGDEGYRVEPFNKPQEAIKAFTPGHYDLVITDIKMPVMDGLQVLQRIKEMEPGLAVIMITAYATVETSIQALRKGAYDMLAKPFEPEELLSRVRNALNHRALIKENRELKAKLHSRRGTIIGNSAPLLAVLEMARKVATRDIPVLITGESGTGKELIARAIHQASNRSERNFVAINCGAIPETLLESELFGHRKGAFTGADRNHKGLVETADGGTLFLDEVGTLPLIVQKTLLRFLQDQEFYRVGDARPSRVDVRIISATNMDLEQAAASGGFREDLYYRLNVFNLHLPPLRERRSDIPLLAAHFIKEQNTRFDTWVGGFTPEAQEALCRFDWPGNIRQLENVIQAAMVLENGDTIGCDTLVHFIDLPQKEPGAGTDPDQLDFAAALARFESDYLTRLLAKTGGNVEDTAQQAGMNVATIYRKMKKYGLR